MNGETSREEMTEPSSSTPASPPTELIKDLLTELDSIAFAYDICAYGLPLGHKTEEPAMIAAVNEWLEKLASVRAASTGTGWISGWESGRDDAAARLCEEIISWESEARCNGTTSWEKDFINKRIGQIKTHIAQIREIPLPAPPVASQKGETS